MDLRFTDATGSHLVGHEIDEWNTNGISSIWVQVPLLAGTNDSIWAYWGNPAGTNLPASSTNGSVWSQDFGGFPNGNGCASRFGPRSGGRCAFTGYLAPVISHRRQALKSGRTTNCEF